MDDDGRDDYHDPTRGLGGAAPARSALTLRLVLASIGVVACGSGAVIIAATGGPLVAVVLFVLLAVVGLVDLAVVARRKRRGEPG